ncbi:sialin-like isoform X2 [Phlebotomus papatasi]|nr:sialin-like isoform X2 [Phlebotomus papatasi]
MRNCFSVVILEMTAEKNIQLENGTWTLKREFEWDSKMQGYILSIFSYGFIITQFLGGLICAKFGGIRVLSAGVGMTSIMTLATPVVSQYGYKWVMALRFLQGLLEGPGYPCILYLVVRWACIEERSRMTSIALSGVYVGNVLNLPVTGAIVVNYGWRAAFYIFGSLGFIWAVLFVIVVKSSPEVDPFISLKEKIFIQQSLSSISHTSSTNYKIPLRAILTSSAVWSIALISYSTAWGGTIFFNQLPRFFTDKMNLSIDEAGYVSAIPFIFGSLSFISSGLLLDTLIQKKILTVYQCRRHLSFLAVFVESIFIVIAAQMTNFWSFIVLLTLGVLLEPIAILNYTVNIAELCPVSAPTILSIATSFTATAGMVTPIFVGYVTQNKEYLEWQIVFYTISAWCLVSSSIYWIFCRTDIQPWSPIKNNDNGSTVNP